MGAAWMCAVAALVVGADVLAVLGLVLVLSSTSFGSDPDNPAGQVVGVVCICAACLGLLTLMLFMHFDAS